MGDLSPGGPWSGTSWSATPGWPEPPVDIIYPRAATIFAAVSAALFSIVGVPGKRREHKGADESMEKKEKKRVAAKNPKHQRRKRQSVTAQTRKVANAKVLNRNTNLT